MYNTFLLNPWLEVSFFFTFTKESTLNSKVGMSLIPGVTDKVVNKIIKFLSFGKDSLKRPFCKSILQFLVICALSFILRYSMTNYTPLKYNNLLKEH